MAVEDTPWFIGAAGVLHPAETARAVAYAAANGSDGVVGSTDLKVTARPTPNGQVLVGAGAVNLLSRYSGAASQAYTGVVRTQEAVNIDPTSSAGGRSDLVVARVRDPQYGSVAGYDPNNPNAFGFFTIEVVKGVSSSFKRYGPEVGYPVMALARIDIPASTATITNAMITDLRFKSNARSDIQVRTIFPGDDNNAAVSQYAPWPQNTIAWFDVPPWATRAVFTVHIPGIEFTGSMRSALGVRGKFGTQIDTQNTIVLQSTSGRVGHTHVSEYRLPTGSRGLPVGYVLEAWQTSGNGGYQIDYQSAVQYVGYFFEDVE